MATTPAAAASDRQSDVSCKSQGDANVAVIEFSEHSSSELWDDAREFAQASLKKCDLDGRKETELAGEVRAHVIGEDAPGHFNPGETIDMAGSGIDYQEDQYGWLMGDDLPWYIPVPSGVSTS